MGRVGSVVVLLSACVSQRSVERVDATDAGPDSDAGSDGDADTDVDTGSDAGVGVDPGEVCPEGMTPRFEATKDTVDEQGWTSRSLAVDAAGGAHVLYDGIEEGLWHAANKTGEWVPERILSPAPGAAITSRMVLDGLGAVHLLAADLADGGGLLYLTNESGAWTATDVGFAIESVPVGFTLASDGSAHAMVASPAGLVHLTNAAGDWTSDALPGTSGVGSGLPAVGEDGVVHVAFLDTHDDFQYGNERDGWALTTIERWVTAGALAIDVTGNVAVAYVVYSPLDARLARMQEDGSFDITSVPWPFGVGTGAFAFEAPSRFHVAGFRDMTVVYGTSALGGWTVADVDAIPIETPLFGLGLVAPGPEGVVHVVFDQAQDFGDVVWGVPRHVALELHCEEP